MSVDEFVKLILSMIPLVSFLSLAVSLLLFVKYKGTVDALKEASATYENLAKAYKEKIEELEGQIDDQKKRIEELEKSVAIEKKALSTAIDEVLNGFKRQGFCDKAATCKDFKEVGE